MPAVEVEEDEDEDGGGGGGVDEDVGYYALSMFLVAFRFCFSGRQFFFAKVSHFPKFAERRSKFAVRVPKFAASVACDVWRSIQVFRAYFLPQQVGDLSFQGSWTG